MAELDEPEFFDKVVASLESQLKITGIKKVGNGLEFCILRGEMPSGPVAIKVPRDRIFSNVNDAHIDSRVLLDQEFAIMRHLEEHGFTHIPDPISDLEAAGFGALVMSYVLSDDSKPDEYELGQLLAQIHSLKSPAIDLSAQEGSPIPELIGARLTRRWKELAVFEADLPELPHEEDIVAALQGVAETKQLLHMDYRQANLRTQKGKVVAVVDWSNALAGHPALELARVAETGETGKEFLRGYASVKPLPDVSKLIETIFRLDTAVMLALVFLSEDPDPRRAPQAVKRVRALYKTLRENIQTT